MGDTQKTIEPPAQEPAAAPAAPTHAGTHGSAEDSEQRRRWYIDEVVVASFALLGLAGGVLLPLRYPVPPITTSFLLATGLAALAYRYLGGIQGADFTVGALKLGGSLAALVGIAMLINVTLAKQMPPIIQVYEVSGQVVDEAGKAIEPLDTKDIAVKPRVYELLQDGKFKADIHNSLGIDGKPELPQLVISHDGYDHASVDLNSTTANNGVTVQRQGQKIDLGRVVLKRLPQQYQPNTTAVPVPPAQPVASGGQS
ncbi:MAG TPA: hypothetical protein VGJ21_15885 [Terracidiphilus sp.]